MNHEILIQRCLDLAIQGKGYVSPNPLVGCVITDADGLILSEGFHGRYGGPHAEVVAFDGLKQDIPPGARLYVSLEPCNHYGKTPPCTERILESGIKEVFVADVDPNPLVAGKGLERLRNAGIQVTCGILQEQAAELNRKFYTQHTKGRPWFTLKWAQSLNGKMGNSTYSSDEDRRISGKESHIYAHRLRAESDAILVGVNTIISDNPSLNTRLWPGKSPVIVVLDPDLKIPSNANILQSEEKVLIFNRHRNEKIGLIEYISIDFHNWNDSLNNELLHRKIQSVLVEGGQNTLQNFIDKELWDECYLFQSGEVKNWDIDAPAISGTVFNSLKIGNDQLTILRPTT